MTPGREKGRRGTAHGAQTACSGVFPHSLSHSHSRSPLLRPRPAPNQPGATAATHPPHASGSPTPSSAWWASPRRPQVGPQPRLCTCHTAVRQADPAAPSRCSAAAAGAPQPSQGRAPSPPRRAAPCTPTGGGRGGGGDGGGVPRAGRARAADAEGALGERRRAGADARSRDLAVPREEGGDRAGKAASAPPPGGPYHCAREDVRRSLLGPPPATSSAQRLLRFTGLLLKCVLNRHVLNRRKEWAGGGVLAFRLLRLPDF